MIESPKLKRMVWSFSIGCSAMALVISLFVMVNVALGFSLSTTLASDLLLLVVGLTWFRPLPSKNRNGSSDSRPALILMILFALCFASAMVGYAIVVAVSGVGLFWYLGIAIWILNIVIKIRDFQNCSARGLKPGARL